MKENLLLNKVRMPPDRRRKDLLIVMGLPRSGSSFFSEILSQIDDWYVFDDLYLHRRAKELGVKAPLTGEDLKALLFFLGWQIRARLRFGLYAVPEIAEEEIEPMNNALTAAFTAESGGWFELQEEWMSRIAARSDCSHWDYKMPSAFRYSDELISSYPNLKVIFLMRNPYQVLTSFKNLPDGGQDGDARRYHPVVYAYYWRAAVRSYLALTSRLGKRIALVQFEELVAQPGGVAKRIAKFLGAQSPNEIVLPDRKNTSFGGARTVLELNGLEKALVGIIAGPELERLGYERETAPIGAKDIGDFLRVSLRFVQFHSRNGMKKVVARLMHERSRRK